MPHPLLPACLLLPGMKKLLLLLLLLGSIRSILLVWWHACVRVWVRRP
jgi:hypothetical protein